MTQFGAGSVAAASLALVALAGWWSNRRAQRIRHELQEGAERLELALAGADLGLWDWDVPSGRVTTNARWLTMIGWSPDTAALTYQTWAGLIHPDDLDVTEAVVRAHLRGETPGYEAVFRMRHRNGSWVWILARGKVMERDAAERPLRVLGTHADVTQDKLAKEALQDSEARAQALFSHLPVGAVVHAADTRVLAANPQACRVLGLSEAQMQGRVAMDPVWALTDESGLPLSLSQYPVNQVASTGQPLEGLLVGVRRPGEAELLWVTCNGYPVRDASGRVLQIVITFADVTGHKRAEAERQHLAAQLRESQKMEAIGTLAGGIAHDFNNIVGAILGNAGLARAVLEPGHPVEAYLAQITKAGGRARELVQQILAFSRRQPQALKSQDLRGLLNESLALLRATLPAGVTLVGRWGDDAVVSHVDATQLQQVVVNLCTNAWHALNGGAGRIEVGLATASMGEDVGATVSRLPAGRYAHLWVKDSGAGIDPAVLPRIFEPFFTTKPVGVGTGLGLSVVHGIVAAHHGAITVDSTPGLGTTFHIYLPLATEAPSPEELESPSLGILPSPPGRGEHVVYVDDDETMTLMVAQLLAHAGYRVSTFTDPTAALSFVREHGAEVNVVVTDFNMPGMSGVELTKALRLTLPDMPVIIGSGYLSDVLSAQMSELRVNALLQKENTLEQLGGLVHQVLTASHEPADSSASAAQSHPAS
ncbi:PAS domain S-box protein [Aquabacterium sp.]|uniref:hybrid sensor histidine kinase/response regulator n=1 Tax=Aquabacterium sp. TaxID=1872578 RepID=UPI002E32BDE7|nr:PAS domain S-box protein [Aquabacterium sp.]HEX5311952.1 PAS domain S-box protein [Aquabacterium sp.]